MTEIVGQEEELHGYAIPLFSLVQLPNKNMVDLWAGANFSAIGPIQEKLYTYPPSEGGDVMLLPNLSAKWAADSWLCDETQDLGTSHPQKNKIYANKTVTTFLHLRKNSETEFHG